MAAFGVSFPKLTLCRSSTSKADTNTVSTTTTTPTLTTSARTLSLSIKNVPSQPLHYDVSTIVKKKPTSIATILAIDGETKQLPKNLSVFNELQLDCEPENIDEKRRREENSSDVIVPSSLSPMGTIDHRPDTRFLANIDPKKTLYDSKDEENKLTQERRSNHTFTPPTSSLSNGSSSNDLHLTLSSISADLPQLNYAIEKFLVDNDNPVYQIVEEFSSGCSALQQDPNGNAHSSNVTTFDFKNNQHDKTDNMKRHSMHEKNINNEAQSHPQPISNSIKWYVSELRINRPLIYRTQWTNRQQRSNNRKLSHSVNDLKQIYTITNHQQDCRYKAMTGKTNDITYSTLSLQNFNNQQQRCHQSDDNILLINHLSCTDDDLNNLHSDEDDQHLSPIQRTLGRSIGRDDTLIRNESVKKKLFDILNDDELENACLEDMSQEFEKMSLIHHHRDLPIINSFSSSSDDALYSSPPNEIYIPLPPRPPLSSSYNENLSSNINNTREHYFGRSRLITTSLDKISTNNNAYDRPSSPRLSYEHIRPSWYTSPSPQWRIDDQLPIISVLKKHSSKNDEHLNNIDSVNSNQLLRTKVTEYRVKDNKYIEKYNHHHRKEQKHVSYSLMNSSTPLVDDSTTILPIIQDKSSNLLMFI